MSQHCLELRSEDEFFLVSIEVERLDANSIAGQDQSAGLPVPDGEREHAAQPIHEPVAHFLIEMDEDFGIAVSLEAMAAGLEVGAERLIVVDLAVEDDLDGTVLV